MADGVMRKNFTKIQPIVKGWSEDKKYCVETADHQRMFLRVSDISEHDRKKAEYGMMERVYELGVLTPEPLGFGFCDSGKSVYSLSSWLDGEDAEKALPLMSETEQYVLGIKAGETLRKIHTLPAPENAEPWSDWFYRKVQRRIDFYDANPRKYENGDIIVRFLQDNKYMLDNRPQTFNHGDFNKSNLMVMPDGQIGVIDFNAYNKDHGDPWWEFDPTNWGNEPNAYFCTGLINGYFDNEPPNEFFHMLMYYLAYDALAALCETAAGRQGEPEEGRRHLDNIFIWFDNMKNPVPTWYKQNIELMDIYDENRNRTGRFWIRGSGNRKEDEYILIAAALLRRSDGRYLLTKRDPRKDDANKWNIQGGAALAGEDSLTAAIRENGEECGIIPDLSSSELFMSVVKNAVFFDIWLFKQEFSLNEVVLCDGETCSAAAYTLDEIIALNSRGEFTNGTVITADEFIARLKNWEDSR